MLAVLSPGGSVGDLQTPPPGGVGTPLDLVLAQDVLVSALAGREAEELGRIVVSYREAAAALEPLGSNLCAPLRCQADRLASKARELQVRAGAPAALHAVREARP